MSATAGVGDVMDGLPEAVRMALSTITEFVAQLPHGRDMLRSHMVQLLHPQGATGGAPNRGADASAYRRVLPAIEFMQRHFAQVIAIGSLAALCHLSVTQFRRRFQVATTTAPQRYLTAIRLTHAERMLQTSRLKIVDIAHLAGFASLSSFNRAFQLARRHTPRQVRSASHAARASLEENSNDVLEKPQHPLEAPCRLIFEASVSRP